MLRLEERLSIDFGLPGEDRRYLGDGWSLPEPCSRWSVGTRSKLVVPAPDVPGQYALLITAVPFLHPRGPWSQRLAVRVNGTPVREGRYNTLTVLAGRFAWDGAGDDKIEVTLEHADAARPSDCDASGDGRQLGFAISNVKLLSVTEAAPNELAEPSAATTRGRSLGSADCLPADRDLLLRFASLGDNCELGIVQRRLQAEALDLFRFAAIPLPKLMTGLHTGLAGIDAPELIEVQLRGEESAREFIFCHTGYQMESHTLVLEGQQPGHRVFLREQRRVGFLARMLLKDLRLGGRIMVIKRNDRLALSDVMPLFLRLREYGPNTLLWVEQAGDGKVPGTVEVLREGLMKGYVARFAPYDKADGAEAELWLPMCRQAYCAWADIDQPAAVAPDGVVAQ
ncbi:MAG: hypothetical protein JO047_09235 [Alphaproteobacteria bacterium]|nr:hypothetical protein [Alphaproteobacteria bacterium]